MPKFPSQLFLIPNSTWSSLDNAEILSTVEAMKQLGIYRLPYPEVSVRVMTSDGNHYVQFNHLSLEHTFSFNTDVVCLHPKVCDHGKVIISVNDYTKKEWGNTDAAANVETVHRLVSGALITLLATRNAIKTTTENKLAKLGIGTKKHNGSRRFQYTTTITIPHESDLPDCDHPESAPSGTHKCPHLRRGHVRSQHYGPKNSFTKQIFIEPIFVNADPSFTSKRDHYNLSI